jgi:6-phosphogluconolactonase
VCSAAGARPPYEKGWHVKTTVRDVSHFTVLGLLLVALTSCGGGGGGVGGMYTIGGTVTGLPAWGLVLQNNAGDDLALCTSCAFTFTTALANGAAYAVTVKTQPTAPAQNWEVVGNGSGTVDGANVTDLEIVCLGRFAYGA